ncbi:unnamed protein product [Boreogadus saida]
MSRKGWPTPHLPLRLPPASLQRRLSRTLNASPCCRNNACLTPTATPDSGPNCSPTPSPSRRAFPDIIGLARCATSPNGSETRYRHPGPDEGGSSQIFGSERAEGQGVVHCIPQPYSTQQQVNPQPSINSSSSYNPTTSNISIQPSINSSNSYNPATSNIGTQPRTTSSNLNNCNPTPNPTQPRTNRPKEEWLEHLIHHFNLSKKKQKKEAQQEGSLGELLKQMCKMNIEKDMEATRQLKERAEENLDLMAMMSLMTHQQETFPQVNPTTRVDTTGQPPPPHTLHTWPLP